MSLLDVTPEIEDVLRMGSLDTANLVDVFLDDGSRHYSDLVHEITIDDGTGPVVYQPLGTRLISPEDVEQNQSLDDTSVDIFLDSSRISDPSDPVGELISNQIIQRRVRLRSVLFSPDTNKTVPLWLFNVRDGVIDGIDDKIKTDRPSAVKIRIASGTFAYLERLNITYSDASQQELYPGDTGFQHIAQLVDVALPWRGKFG